MDPGVIAALVGVPTSVIAAAIAYPVGRGVARRQAADAHEQWLRAERRTAAQCLADAATGYIEALAEVREKVERPDYAHTRRRDITSRKRLDPALYEPPKNALRAMHTALSNVVLHGPNDVTETGQCLYNAALTAADALLCLDAVTVERDVVKAETSSDQYSQQRAEAALEDLDTAYIRLAAPLGLPNFTTDVAQSLERAAVLSAFFRVMRAVTSPSITPTAALKATKELRELSPEDPQLRRMTDSMTAMLEPFFQRMASLGTSSPPEPHAQTLAGNPAALAEVERLVALMGNLSDPDQDAYTRLNSLAPDLEQITHLLQQADEHVTAGDELTVSAWMAPLASHAEETNTRVPHLRGNFEQTKTILVDIMTRRIETARTAVNDSEAKVFQARMAFLDTARDAIGAHNGT
ncbi:hypothetical protein GTZ89_26395 [Streptomyces sp. SID8382]|uniref:hypothetical protein n=1 Tax=Streptomyces malaysiensis TaxID=92644 RepID=UPI000C2C53B7|nr:MULTISPECIES: hypothetical protein [unclassified Streptomyces]AUA17252.1 hypothetical protein CFP59_09446 [Streptomyces sp. M56]MYX59098.1 hypothetical protein [Streptomyces sp. SID8382]